jgi:hypothetical protein
MRDREKNKMTWLVKIECENIEDAKKIGENIQNFTKDWKNFIDFEFEDLEDE